MESENTDIKYFEMRTNNNFELRYSETERQRRRKLSGKVKKNGGQIRR